MFGYVRPLEGELKVRELEEYKAVYCGLCHSLGKRCGFLSRFILNYDFVFLAMLLEEGTDGGTTVRHRCVAHPLAGRKCTLCSGLVMDLAAEESVILAYYKLRDDFQDEKVGKRLVSRLLALFLKPAYKKARKTQPDFDRRVKECLAELEQLEQAGSEKLDQVSDTFARVLQAAAPSGADPARERVLAQLLYHLGRWIYLVDGMDDWAEDMKQGRYNPVVARFGGNVDKEYMKTTLNNSLSLIQAAFQLLEKNRWTPILENILYLGLPAVQAKVWKDSEDPDKKKRAGDLL